MKWYMNEEREMLQNAFRDFAQTRIRPHVDAMEKEEVDSKELLKEMGKLGFFALGKDEKYGGAGKDQINVALLLEEIAKESYTFGLLTLIQHLFITEIIKCGTEEQIQEYAVPAMTGDKLIALCSCEASGGNFFDGYSTKAVLDGDEWVINGGKVLITQVDVADAYIISCKTADKVNPMTMEGFASFLVPADAEGIRIGHIENKMGWKGSHTGSIYFENVRVPASAKTPVPCFTTPALGLGGMYAAMDLGGAEKCLEKTIEIVKGRIQEGGLSQWDAHEAMRHDIASLTARVSVLKNSIYSHMMNLTVNDSNLIEDFGLKIDGADVLAHVARECMVLAGGAGVIYETGIERYYRDAVLSEIGCGSNKTFLSFMAFAI